MPVRGSRVARKVRKKRLKLGGSKVGTGHEVAISEKAGEGPKGVDKPAMMKYLMMTGTSLEVASTRLK